MRFFETDSIPKLLEEKKITIGEASTKLWVDIYFNPRSYNLADLDMDSLSEFLIRFQEKFPHIIKCYDKTKTNFTTFVRSCMMQFKMIWKKKEAKDNAKYKTLEYSLKKSALDPTSINEYFDPAENIEKISASTNSNNESFTKQTAPKMTKLNTEAKETALILALKACKDLDDESISKLSNFINRSEIEIHNLIERLKEKMNSKTQNREKLIRRRDRSFFIKRKAVIELEKLEKNCSEYTKLRGIYENQMRNWQKNNKNLSHRYLMTPKNSDIAEELGISLRKVYYCISHAKNKETMECFKEIFNKTIDQNEISDKN